jgi:hypothetical protein
MALFGLVGAIVHHKQLVDTGHKGKTKKLVETKDGKFESVEEELTTGDPFPKFNFGQRRSRFSNRSR